MNAGIYILVIALFVAVGALSAILIADRRAMRTLTKELEYILSCDTNNLLTIHSGSRALNRLADSLNGQLRILRRRRLHYTVGDAEVKKAVSNISHDLRTPLTAVFGYLALLEQESMSPAARHYVSAIENRSEAMKTLCEELFQYALALSGEQALQWEEVNLCAALEDSLAGFYGVFTKNHIVPNVILPDRPVLRRLDGVALQRILGNIFGNAVKYSAGDLEIALTPQGSITVSNYAPSLSGVDVGRLFDRYYTVSNGGSSTGLGLSIARLLTERMDGTISAAYERERLIIILHFA